VPGAIEVAQREKGFNKGLFEWLRKAPGAILLLGDVHLADRLRLPGRYLRRDDGAPSSSTSSSTTPSTCRGTSTRRSSSARRWRSLGLTYFLIPTLFRRELMFPGMAKWQPYLFGLGMCGFSLS